MAGAGAIPASRIYEAAARCGMVDPDDRDRFVTLVRACDTSYLHTILGERNGPGQART